MKRFFWNWNLSDWLCFREPIGLECYLHSRQKCINRILDNDLSFLPRMLFEWKIIFFTIIKSVMRCYRRVNARKYWLLAAQFQFKCFAWFILLPTGFIYYKTCFYVRKFSSLHQQCIMSQRLMAGRLQSLKCRSHFSRNILVDLLPTIGCLQAATQMLGTKDQFRTIGWCWSFAAKYHHKTGR